MSAAIVVGLGPMGAGMGRRLISRGWEVVGVDIDPRRRTAFSKGTRSDTVASVHEVRAPSVTDVVVAVRMADQVHQILEDVAANPSLRGTNVVLTTTLSMADSRSVEEAWGDRLQLVHAPVSGGPEGAETGQLTLFLFARRGDPTNRPLYRDIGGEMFLFDSVELPSAHKLLNNTLAALNAEALVEMLAQAEGLGVDLVTLLRVVNCSSGGSWISHNFPSFAHELLIKDVSLLRPQLTARDQPQDWPSRKLGLRIEECRKKLESGVRR